jgi:bacteriocin resistance YdeI/OmpD-like protein/uncharacterized protein DUF1905
VTQEMPEEVDVTFRSTIQLNGKTATGIPVPTEVIEALGGGKRPKVRATVNGYTYRTSVVAWGDGYMMSFSSEQREASGLEAGAEVEVDLALDTAPREVTVPADLAAALDAEADAKRFFETLSYSNQRWHVLSIEGAKAADTRQRRIDKSIAMLREGRAR